MALERYRAASDRSFRGRVIPALKSALLTGASERISNFFLRFGTGKRLQRYAFCGLAFDKERLWHFAVAAEFERAKILVPLPFGQLRSRLKPKAELVETRHTDGSISHPIDKLLTNCAG